MMPGSWDGLAEAVSKLMEADRIKDDIIDDLFQLVVQLGGVEALDRRILDQIKQAAKLTEGLN
jgi:predicted transcriptional regulator